MKKIEIMDTTLRDGEQMESVSFSTSEKVAIAKRLFKLGIDRIEVASARSVEEDSNAIKEICKFAKSKNRLKDVEVLGFVDGKKSVDWIYKHGCRTINLLAKGSYKQLKGQLNNDLNEHIKNISIVANYAKTKNMDVNIYLEDWSTGMIEIEEKSNTYVYDLIKDIEKLNLIKRIMLADTLGKLSPSQTGNFIKELKEKFPKTHFDYHAHNDYELAVANSLEALKHGINGIHCTINGLGERAGNCGTFSLSVCAKDHLNIDLGLIENEFFEFSKFLEIASKVRISPIAPIVGANTCIQTAGVHADGDSKKGLYKTKLTGERFGQSKNHSYALGKQSGQASINMNLKQLGINANKDIIKTLTKKVRDLGAKKNKVTQDDLYFLYLNEAGKEKKNHFKVLDCRSDISMNGERIGVIKVRLNGKIIEESGVGDGGYDAIMNALIKILRNNNIKIPKLIDYDPIIPPGGGTGALVEAIIEWKLDNKIFKTIGVDTDQTIAAVKATEKMVNIILIE